MVVYGAKEFESSVWQKTSSEYIPKLVDFVLFVRKICIRR